MMKIIMRAFFRLLYHPFAFTYDLVASAVSFGNWKDWVFSIVPYIDGARILELGHGPGHLQRFLVNRGFVPIAIDESEQMGLISKRRLAGKYKLVRGFAQSIPFKSNYFDTVISTFPSEFIFDSNTIEESKRVLCSGGRLIVLPAALPSSRILKWLFRVTGESPSNINQFLESKFLQPFAKAGFDATLKIVEHKSALIIFIIATK